MEEPASRTMSMNARARNNRKGSLDRTSHYIYMNRGITKDVIQVQRVRGRTMRKGRIGPEGGPAQEPMRKSQRLYDKTSMDRVTYVCASPLPSQRWDSVSTAVVLHAEDKSRLEVVVVGDHGSKAS